MFRVLVVAVACALLGCAPARSERESSSPQRRAEAVTSPAEAFAVWKAKYFATPADERPALEEEGAALAAARSEDFRRLILEQPEAAIAAATTPTERLALPASVSRFVERWRDGLGTLHVIAGIAADPDAPAPLLERFVTFEGEDTVLRAAVFGRRLGEATRERVRLHGVELDGAIAITDSRLRHLFPGEPRPPLRAEWPRACPVSKKDIDSAEVYHGGDALYGFCVPMHANQFDTTLALGETEAAAAAGLPPSSAWTDGAKTVLYVRVDFSDRTGDPLSASSAQSMIDSSVNQFYVANSFNKTTLSATVTPTLRLPKTRADYQTNDQYLLLRSDALAAARDAGFEPNDYNLDIVAFASTYSGWAGRGYVGGRGTWLNGYFDLRVTGHELGHNYGLNHANFWNSTGVTIIGPGSNTEYGNPLDIMGSNGSQAHHFNAWFKRLLQWMPDAEIATVTASTTVRLAELEKPLVAGFHAAKINRDTQKDYWLEYRPAHNTAHTRDGISINWGYPYNTGSHLLDMTPGDGSRTNSTLVIGRTFSDVLAGIHLTPVAKAGTTPEAIDVVVNLGTFPGNRPPTLTLAASTQTPATGQTVTFTATASDPDGDPLAWAWDFDDGTWGPNSATVTKTFSAAREHAVRLVVSDMKGGTTSQTVLITVGTPTTFTLRGTVLAGATPVEGVRISDGTRATFTSADGAWALTNVPAGSFTLTASKVDFTFTRSFAAPLTVSASQSGLDFAATPVAGYTLRGKVAFGTTNIAGAIVTDGTRTATTNGSGDYALAGVPTGRVTLTASKPGWVLVPSGFTNPVEVYGGDVSSLNFTGTGQSLYGTIPLAGVATAPVVTDGVRTATATQSGSSWYWSLSGVPNGSWNVLATSPGVTLTPSTFTNPVLIAGQSRGNLNFDVVAGTSYLVQGTVKTGTTPIPGVVISDGTRTATTDSLGRYTLAVPPGTYPLTPTHPSYTFVPASLSVTVTTANVTGRDFSTTTVNLPPTVATAASASPSPVLTGTTTTLSVLGADDGGESALTYGWSSSNGYPVTFSANGTNAAKNVTATFSGAGTFTIECVITDAGGLAVRTSVVVQVRQVATRLEVTPTTATVSPSTMRTFQANLRDQFNNYLFAGAPTWTLTGAGTLAPSGTLATYTAPALAGGPYTITAAASGFMASAQVTVAGTGAPTITTPASAAPSPVTGTTTQLSVRATDDGGERGLVYRWTVPVAAAPVTFSVNDDNTAKDTTVTFTSAGHYTFLVTVVDQLGNAASRQVEVEVVATASSVALQPLTASVQVGQSLAFTATASDQFGAAMSPAPAFTWTTTGGGTFDPNGLFTASTAPGGPFTVTAASGAVSATAQLTVTAAPDLEPPMVSLTQPVGGAQLTGLTQLVATATDNVGVVRVEFIADGLTSLGTLAAAPWELSFDTASLTEGTHVLTARAVDAAGNVATSDAVTVTIGNGPVDREPPSVRLTAPADASATALSFLATVEASDDLGVISVAYELDGAVVATSGAAPWSATLSTSAGPHTLVAIAQDASGRSARSAPVSFVASDGLAEPPPTPLEPERVVGGCGGCTSSGGTSMHLLAALGLLILRARRK
ncbi:MAG: Ig-like domain-containing protein [Myxococcota bacterium]